MAPEVALNQQGDPAGAGALISRGVEAGEAPQEAGAEAALRAGGGPEAGADLAVEAGGGDEPPVRAAEQSALSI